MDESAIEYNFEDFREKLALLRKTNQFKFDGKLYMPTSKEESIKWVIHQFDLVNETEHKTKKQEPIRDVIRALLHHKNWYKLKQSDN